MKNQPRTSVSLCHLSPYLLLDVKCITLHEGFGAVCLNPYVLWAAMVSLNDREGAWLPPDDDIPNRLETQLQFKYKF